MPGPSPKGISVWKQYSSPRERSALTPSGWVLAFLSVGGGASTAPPAFHQTGWEGVEVEVKMPPTSFQDSFNPFPPCKS